MNISKRFKTLQKLIDRHEKRIEEFQREAELFFHPHAVMLCRRIKKGIDEFQGCQLGMRRLFLEPRDLKIPITNKDGDKSTIRLALLTDEGYLDDTGCGMDEWKPDISEDTKEALRELHEMSNYIDGNYSMVAGLYVDLTKKKV